MGCHLHFCKALSAIWCALSGGVINLVSLALVVCHQPLFCWPCLNVWVWMSALCQQSRPIPERGDMTGALPSVLFASSAVVGHFQVPDLYSMLKGVTSTALHSHYSGCTAKGISFHLKKGLSAPSLYPRDKHQWEQDDQGWKNISSECACWVLECASPARQELSCTWTWTVASAHFDPRSSNILHSFPLVSHSSYGERQQQALPCPEGKGTCRTSALSKLASQNLSTLPLALGQVCCLSEAGNPPGHQLDSSPTNLDWSTIRSCIWLPQFFVAAGELHQDHCQKHRGVGTSSTNRQDFAS